MTQEKVLTLVLAARFIIGLTQELRPDQFETACVRNVNAKPGICHSHDFCDANMTMHDAWCATFNAEPDVANEKDAAIWSAAWTIATKLMADAGRSKAADFIESKGESKP